VGRNSDETVQEPVHQENNMWIIPNNEAVGEDVNKPPIRSSPRPQFTAMIDNSEQKNSPIPEEDYTVMKSPSPDPNFYELDDVDSDMSSLHVSGTATSFLPQPGTVIAAPSSAPPQSPT